MKKIIIYTLSLVSLMGSIQAQVKIGDNVSTLNANSILELESTSKGLLISRVALTNTTSASPLAAHVEGMVVYNTATTGDVFPGIYYNTGLNWVNVIDGDAWNVVQEDQTSQINRSGRVVIGTDPTSGAPQGDLEVHSTTTSFPGGNGKNLKLTHANYPSIWFKRAGGANDEGFLMGVNGTGFSIYEETADTYIGPPSLTAEKGGNVGIKRGNPASRLHITAEGATGGTSAVRVDNNAGTVVFNISDNGSIDISNVINLTPLLAAPAAPSKGTMYFDNTTNKLRVYDGSAWRDCF